MSVYKETGLKEDMKIVISSLERTFNVEDIDSALGAIGYAAKECLRLTESVTGTGDIYGNVMILDVYIPLDSSNSHDVMSHADEFQAAIVQYLMNGVFHQRARKLLGDFGRLNVGFVESQPSREVTVTINTSVDAEAIRQALENAGLGHVLSVQ